MDVAKKARSDQIDHCPQLTQIQEILRRSALFYFIIMLNCWDFWPSRNHDKPADRWPDTKMIANFSHVTARYNCKDQKSEIWRCNAVWEFNTLPLSTWPTSPHLAMLWRIFAALNFKYLKNCIFVQMVEIAQYLGGCLSKHVKWVDQSEEPAPVQVCCFDKYLWPWQYSKCWEITTWSGCLWVKFCWSMCVCVRCESCFS